MMRTMVRACSLAGLLVLGCSASHAPTASSTSLSASPEFRVAVAHRDARLGVPSFVWMTPSPATFHSAEEGAERALDGLAKALEFRSNVRPSLRRASIHDTGAGPIIARYRQHIGNVEIFRAELNILMRRTFEPMAATGVVIPSLDGSSVPFSLSPIEALERAHGAVTATSTSFHHGSSDDEEVRFTSPDLHQPARVKRVFFPVRETDGEPHVVPGYHVELMFSKGPAWSIVVSAVDGSLLFRHDLVRYDSFSYRAFANPDTLLPMDGPQGNATIPHPTGTPDGYHPAWVPSPLVTLANYPFSQNDPWLPPGATETSGNNVDAYADIASSDGFSLNTADVRSTITSTNTFDHPYDTSKSPDVSVTSIKGAVTHLFYVTNFMHDWFYDVGFDEAAGNHQASNFSRGGKGSDPLLAEAQDYSGRNNANAATPSDGASPRLQMYVFSGTSEAELNVLSPATIAGKKSVGIASFGKDAFEASGPVVLAIDGQGNDVNDGCEQLTNNVTSKIVLVHRGLCSFVQKVQNVQNAGGVGVIITNVSTSSSPTTPPYMGGTALNITIPALSLSLADGQALEAALASDVTVGMKRELQTDLDGALDTSIVAHEWGHVLANRLIGNGSGITTNQAMGLGEGWSDFVALLLLARADDIETAVGKNWAGAYPKGAYAMSGSGSDYYFGIRRVPYSVDFTKDPLTFKHIQNGTPLPTTVPIAFGEDGSFNSEVHATGEVWASMLWECYVTLLRDTRYSFTQAQERMKRYLITALKLTPIDPTLLEARDALLAAAAGTDDQDFQAFWNAFARRGAGVGAEGPGKESVDNVGVKESFTVGNDLQIVSATLKDNVITCDRDGILDEGETGLVEVIVRNAGSGDLEATKVDLSSSNPDLDFLDGTSISFGTLKPFATATGKVRVLLKRSDPVKTTTVDVAVTDPTLANPRTLRAAVDARLEADELPEASDIDSVDTPKTTWTVKGSDSAGIIKAWSRYKDGPNTWWTVVNSTYETDLTLVSPKFLIEGNTFDLTFKHRWSFRMRRSAAFDGGVVEVSTSGGRAWTDISEFGTVDYNAQLDSSARSNNVLKGRAAYGSTSPHYPSEWVTSSIHVTLKDHPYDVQIRFRVGTGGGYSGAPGWNLDDIQLAGIASKPFWAFVPHRDACDPEGPTANAGDSKTAAPKSSVTLQGSGTHPKNAQLAFAWTQIAGPVVKLEGDNTAALSFVAPDTRSPLTLTFALRANDGVLLSPASKVDVNVVPDVTKTSTPLAPGQSAGCGCSHARTSFDPTAIAIAAMVLGLVRPGRRHEKKKS